MKSRIRVSLFLLAGLLVLAAIFHDRILGAMGAYLVQAGPPRNADVAIVLGGDGWGLRILTAAQLARDGYVPKVVVSGPEGYYGNHECDLAIPFAVKHGYPESYFVHAEHNATSTQAEARVLVAEARRAGYTRIEVVTSNYHTRRAGRILHELAPDLTILIVAAPDKYFTPDGWWHNRDAEKIFATEWAKTVANWLGI